MMKNSDQSVKINHHPNWPYIPDHPDGILIIGVSGSGKIYLYVKDVFKLKHQLLINGTEKVGIKKLKHPKAFINYSETIYDVYENLGL